MNNATTKTLIAVRYLAHGRARKVLRAVRCAIPGYTMEQNTALALTAIREGMPAAQIVDVRELTSDEAASYEAGRGMEVR